MFDEQIRSALHIAWREFRSHPTVGTPNRALVLNGGSKLPRVKIEGDSSDITELVVQDSEYPVVVIEMRDRKKPLPSEEEIEDIRKQVQTAAEAAMIAHPFKSDGLDDVFKRVRGKDWLKLQVQHIPE